ncbi:hypothetical protein WJX81_007966 [Elliptochloris bilobata]|uniref:Serine aminopeptidase S33 domain-containing protein n=1 Tax=Elliptochloris bilobata TaxID=381761 RepID=A0AAW1RCB2_9CHLO
MTLVGTFCDSGSQDAAVLCHGLTDYRDGFVLPQLAAALAAAGVSSLRLDMRGNGESEGDFEFANMRDEAEDMRAGVEWLRAQGLRALGLLGHSKSGSGVVLYAAKYDDVPRVVNVSGRFVMARGVKERFGSKVLERLEREGSVPMEWRAGRARQPLRWTLTKEDMANRLSLDMDGPARAVRRSQVLTVHGSDDETIPVEDARLYAERLAGGRLLAKVHARTSK